MSIKRLLKDPGLRVRTMKPTAQICDAICQPARRKRIAPSAVFRLLSKVRLGGFGTATRPLTFSCLLPPA